MAERSLWDDVRERCEALPPGAELVTPVSGRPFRVEATHGDRIAIRFRDSDEERELWREQFEVLADGIEEGPLQVSDLQPGVEPYATVVSLAPSYVADGDAIYRDQEAGTGGESPYLVPPEAAREPPEKVHDDALLVADLLARLDASEPESLDTPSLTDLYVLLSDVQRGADRLRRSASEPLLERLGPDQTLQGRFGSVRRTTRERRSPKDDEVVLDALDEHGIPHEWVLGVDPDKLDVVLAVTDLEESDVVDVDEQVYVQKTGTDEREKVSHLEGLADRLAEVEGEAGEELHEELVALEERIDEALSTG